MSARHPFWDLSGLPHCTCATPDDSPFITHARMPVVFGGYRADPAHANRCLVPFWRILAEATMAFLAWYSAGIHCSSRTHVTELCLSPHSTPQEESISPPHMMHGPFPTALLADLTIWHSTAQTCFQMPSNYSIQIAGSCYLDITVLPHMEIAIVIFYVQDVRNNPPFSSFSLTPCGISTFPEIMHKHIAFKYLHPELEAPASKDRI